MRGSTVECMKCAFVGLLAFLLLEDLDDIFIYPRTRGLDADNFNFMYEMPFYRQHR
jgi:hypothetical protein